MNIRNVCKLIGLTSRIRITFSPFFTNTAVTSDETMPRHIIQYNIISHIYYAATTKHWNKNVNKLNHAAFFISVRISLLPHKGFADGFYSLVDIP